MTQALQDIRNFTVMIQDAQTGKLAGTGFKVKHSKQVLGKTVGVYFPQAKELSTADRGKKAKVEACLEEYDDDIVLLELQGKDPRPGFFQNQAILGMAEPSHKNPYISYGFPKIDAYPESTVDGMIVDLTPSIERGVYQCEVVELNANSKAVNIRQGMSGCAVLDKYRNLVVGIVTSFLDSSTSNKAWAADCKVLSFKPFGLHQMHDVNPLNTPMTPGKAYDRKQYKSVSKPGLELVDAPKPLKQWVGQKDLLRSMREAWSDPECKVLELAGFGGQGKSSLAKKWLDLFISAKSRSKPRGIFWWDFYHHKNLDEFAGKLLSFLSASLGIRAKAGSLYTKLREIQKLLEKNGFLLILDGFEVLQFQTAGDSYGEIKDHDLRSFMAYLASENHHSFAIVTTRVPMLELVNKIYYKHLDVDAMSLDDGVTLLKKLGVMGAKENLENVVNKWAGHPLTLTLLGTYIFEKYAGDLDNFTDVPSPEIDEPQYDRLRRVLFRYDQFLTEEQRRFMQVFCAFHSTVDSHALEKVFRNPESELTELLAKLGKNEFAELVKRLERRGLIREADHEVNLKNKDKNRSAFKVYDVHPLIREYFYKSLTDDPKNAINMMLRAYVQSLKVPKKPKSIEQMRPAFDEVHYLCEAKRYNEAYTVYRQKVAKVDMMPEDETGYLTTVLSGYQADLEVLKPFFPDKNFNNLPTLSDPKELADLLILAGVDLDLLGKADDANILYRKSAQIGIENGEWEYATWSYQNEGTALTAIGKLNEASEVFDLALQYAEKIEAWIRESMSTLVKKAWNEFLLGEVDAADELMERAKEIFAKDTSHEIHSYEHSSEGVMYAELLLKTGRYDEAMNVSNHNLAFLKKEDWQDDVGCHRVIGMIHEARNNYKKAKIYYDKSVKLISKTGMREETISTLLRRGSLLIELNNLDQANNDLQYALALAISCKYLSELDARIALARLAMAKGESVKFHNELLRDLLAIKSKAVETGYKWAENDSLFLLGQLETNNGNTKGAVDYYNQALILQKRLRDPRSGLTLKRLQGLGIFIEG